MNELRFTIIYQRLKTPPQYVSSLTDATNLRMDIVIKWAKTAGKEVVGFKILLKNFKLRTSEHSFSVQAK